MTRLAAVMHRVLSCDRGVEYISRMSHALRDKQKLLNRVRRIRGQVEAIERALESESSCAEVMQQLTSCRGAINGLLGVVVEDHIKTHFGDTPDNVEASEHLLEVVHSYFK